MTIDLFGASCDAVVSACKRYRYRLDRRWADGANVCWVMLNPSTADASVDDPTIRRCLGFSRRIGMGSLSVVNLFAWRATNPADLSAVEDPVGPDADRHMRDVLASSAIVIVAWGASGPKSIRRSRIPAVTRMISAAGLSAHALGMTKTGDPRHPLYLRSDAELIPWP